jgi:hypothetical protein
MKDEYATGVAYAEYGDSSYLAIRAKDGQGIALSSPFGIPESPTFSSFNVNSSSSPPVTKAYPDWTAPLGIGYDSLRDMFFVISGNSELLSLDPVTLNATTIGPITGPANFTGLQWAGDFVFNATNRAACAQTILPDSTDFFISCIDIDTLKVTAMYPLSQENGYYCGPSSQYGFFCLVLPGEYCAGPGNSGVASIKVLNMRKKQILLDIPVLNLNEQLCPINSAVYGEGEHFMLFSKSEEVGSFVVVSTDLSSPPQVISLGSTPFTENVESFVSV